MVTILTLGGGGFSMSDSGESLIDDFAVDLTGKSSPNICFVPTASGDADGYSQKFEAAFKNCARTNVLSLFNHEPWGYQNPEVLLEQDVIYVGGGSTANLLALWRLHGLPSILHQAASNGTILMGISAGMNCWYEASCTDSFGQLAALNDGLGFLPGSACPHYFGEAERQEKYLGLVAAGQLPSGYAADDGVALVWQDGRLTQAITERPEGKAFEVTQAWGSAVERELEVRYLG